MSTRAKAAFLTIALGGFLAVGTIPNHAVPPIPSNAVPQKSVAPKSADKLELGEEQVKQLMLLIDPNEKGKITKQEWMKFMDAEFDRLDRDKSGELDAKELAKSRLQASSFARTGK